jgi:hypothetical protein
MKIDIQEKNRKKKKLQKKEVRKFGSGCFLERGIRQFSAYEKCLRCCSSTRVSDCSRNVDRLWTVPTGKTSHIRVTAIWIFEWRTAVTTHDMTTHCRQWIHKGFASANTRYALKLKNCPERPGLIWELVTHSVISRSTHSCDWLLY